MYIPRGSEINTELQPYAAYPERLCRGEREVRDFEYEYEYENKYGTGYEMSMRKGERI